MCSCALPRRHARRRRKPEPQRDLRRLALRGAVACWSTGSRISASGSPGWPPRRCLGPFVCRGGRLAARTRGAGRGPSRPCGCAEGQRVAANRDSRGVLLLCNCGGGTWPGGSRGRAAYVLLYQTAPCLSPPEVSQAAEFRKRKAEDRNSQSRGPDVAQPRASPRPIGTTRQGRTQPRGDLANDKRRPDP